VEDDAEFEDEESGNLLPERGFRRHFFLACNAHGLGAVSVLELNSLVWSSPVLFSRVHILVRLLAILLRQGVAQHAMIDRATLYAASLLSARMAVGVAEPFLDETFCAEIHEEDHEGRHHGYAWRPGVLHPAGGQTDACSRPDLTVRWVQKAGTS